MAIVTEFTSSIKHGNVVLQSGKVLHFVGGKLRTGNVEEIAYLTEMMEQVPSYIVAKQEVDTEDANPIAGLEAKIRAQILAEMATQAASLDPLRDLGTTESKGFQLGGIGSTRELAATTPLADLIKSKQHDMDALPPASATFAQLEEAVKDIVEPLPLKADSAKEAKVGK